MAVSSAHALFAYFFNRARRSLCSDLHLKLARYGFRGSRGCIEGDYTHSRRILGGLILNLPNHRDDTDAKKTTYPALFL